MKYRQAVKIVCRAMGYTAEEMPYTWLQLERAARRFWQGTAKARDRRERVTSDVIEWLRSK